jgi:starvation-inducible DNA-binding protein
MAVTRPKNVDAPTNAPAVMEALTLAMAETSVLQMKAQNFHWNVAGMAFGPLHELFGKIYTEHFAAMDELAERVKALGGHAEGRYGAFLKLSRIAESDGRLAAGNMLEALADDERHIAATFRRLAAVADQHEDIVTNDMAVARAQAHEKFAWMLSAHLKG